MYIYSRVYKDRYRIFVTKIYNISMTQKCPHIINDRCRYGVSYAPSIKGLLRPIPVSHLIRLRVLFPLHSRMWMPKTRSHVDEFCCLCPIFPRGLSPLVFVNSHWLMLHYCYKISNILYLVLFKINFYYKICFEIIIGCIYFLSYDEDIFLSNHLRIMNVLRNNQEAFCLFFHYFFSAIYDGFLVEGKKKMNFHDLSYIAIMSLFF